jgi:hypothetical protein
MQMADNFFSVLSNRRADIWVDRGMHFVEGREVAFTVGAEGDARNWYYTASRLFLVCGFELRILIGNCGKVPRRHCQENRA